MDRSSAHSHNWMPARRAERTARLLAVLLVLGLPLGLLLARLISDRSSPVVEIHARMPHDGGFLPGEIQAVAGEPLRLRLVSDDVLHGFAVGQTDFPEIDLYPGQTVETTLVFDQPGRYTYVCTRWCGPDHWRMRGVIDVRPAAGETASPPAADPPLYLELGLDLDAPHPARVTPASRPAAVTGIELPGRYRSQDYLRAASPAQVWEALRSDPVTRGMDDEQVWGLVAGLWQESTTPQRLEQGRELYARSCAACHGETGTGDGVFASQHARDAERSDHAGAVEGHASPGGAVDGHAIEAPADFTDPENMLGAAPALLHGKIVRGGMGTGMPYWGTVFSDDQIWMLVEYLWTFQFDLEEGK